MKTPQIWLIAMLKGGARKSTTAILTAFALAAQGHDDVLVIDADPGTQGVTDWASRVYAAGGEMPFHVAQWSQNLGLLVPFVQAQVRQTGATIVIIDVGGEAPEVIRQAIHMIDQVITPVGAEQGEISRLQATREVVRPAGKPMRVLLTRVPTPGKGAAAAARGALVADGFDMMTTEIPRNLALYADVWGFVPDDVGAYADLARELLDLAKVAA